MDGGFDQVAHDLFDIAPDIADLGELGCLDLDEGGVGQLRQAAGDFRFAATGRADHQDVLGQNLFTHHPVKLQAPPAVAQRDCHRALGVFLADNETVQFRNDLPRTEIGHARILSKVMFSLV